MAVTRIQEQKFVEEVADYLVSNLSGSNVKESVKMYKPSREFIIGCLSASFKGTTHQRTIANTNSMAISFLVKEFKPFKINLEGSLYYKQQKNDSKDEDKTPIWKKIPVQFNNIAIPKSNFETELDFKDTITNILNDKDAIKPVPEYDWGIKIYVKSSSHEQNGDSLLLVTVYIVNSTPGDKEEEGNFKAIKNYETSIFNVNASVILQNSLEKFLFKYDYEGYDEKYSSDVKTLNCGAIYSKDSNIIKTTFSKKFYQDLINPKNELFSFDGSKKWELSFEEFKDPNKTNILLNQILNVMNDYLNYYKSQKDVCEKYKDYTSQFERTILQFSKGISSLKDEKIMKAFNLMQEVFFKKDSNQEVSFKNWRLFQIVYIVSLLPDIIDLNSNNQNASVLHVSTGGGKSEAYFGLVVFSAFLDRLEGKTFGLTAITKFPLRMLSIQQLQRIAEVFAWAEEVRKDNSLQGEFSVGYLVGDSTDFPNNNLNQIKEISAALKNKKPLPGKIITTCPICNQKDSVKLIINEENSTIKHKCFNSKCNREFGFYFSDDEIYRLLPTFIISTVDKFANVGMQRKVKNLFGGFVDLSACKHGFIPRGDKCKYKLDFKSTCESKGQPVNVNFSTSPRMIIQDEMHLIREAFGTIDSHFETFIETLSQEFTKLPFKNIAMTATICGASDQILQLYNKSTQIFPGESPDGRGINDFFFIKENNSPHRLILGLTPNMRDNQFASLLTLRLLIELIIKIEKDKDAFCKKLDLSVKDLDYILNYYKAYLTYHNKIADVNGMSYFLEDVANSKLRPTNYSIKNFSLTSALSMDQIKDIINYINSFDATKAKDIPVCFATNLVSHGVDINKWNIMMFQGIPRSTAEYIQALSRVGRQHVGLVLNWFYPNRIRDQSFFQNFNEYHEILDHHVEMVPISRWAKLGFHQTFHTMFCGSILNYLSNKLEMPIYSLEQYRDVFKDSSNLDLIKSFLKKAYSIGSNVPGAKYFENQIGLEVDKRNQALMNYSGKGKEVYFFPNCLSNNDDPYFKMQTGMRGIQDNIELGADDRENNFVNSYKKKYNEEDDDL